MSEDLNREKVKSLFNGFLMGLGFGFVIIGGQGLFLIGSILILVGGSLERTAQRKSSNIPNSK
jgi:uncharacterized membrane protein YedE/YeeE